MVLGVIAMDDKLVRYTLRVDRFLFKKFRYIAESEGRSANKEIEQYLKKRVAQFEEENGKIEIEDDKIITLEKGMIGFPDLNHFALIYDEEKEKKYNSIMWLQSMDDPDIAFPVMMPHIVKEDYNPNVSEEMIAPLGKLTPENTYILVTVTVPKNIEDFSVNLKAPVVINMDNRKGVQMIVEDDYPVKYKVYDVLKAKKEKAGE